MTNVDSADINHQPNHSSILSSPDKVSSKTGDVSPKHAHFNHNGHTINPHSHNADERTKVLTMKYGKHQMSLIRKRIRVETWLMDTLEELYADEDLAEESDLNGSIDELLDLDTESERRNHILSKLTECPATVSEREDFAAKYLEQLSTL